MVAEAMGLQLIDLGATRVDLSLLKGFPIRLIHRYGVFPIRKQEGSLVLATGNPFDLHALDAVSAAVGMSVLPVLAPPAELAKLIKTHLGVGAETIDGLIAQQEEPRRPRGDARGDRVRRLRRRGDRPGGFGRPAGQRDPRGGGRGPRQRHPLGSPRLGDEDPLPYRRRAPETAHPAGNQPLSGGDHQPLEDHGPAEYRREAGAPGRPHQAPGLRPRDRHPRFDHPHAARRGRGDADPGQGPDAVLAARRGHGRGHLRRLQPPDPASPRHHPGDRPHGLRQDDHALQRAERNQETKTPRSSPRKTRSNTNWTGSTRSRSTRKSG